MDTEIELKNGMQFRFMIKDKNAAMTLPNNSELSFSVNHLLDKQNADENTSFDLCDGMLSVVSKEGGIVGGSSGPCVISSIHNSTVYF